MGLLDAGTSLFHRRKVLVLPSKLQRFIEIVLALARRMRVARRKAASDRNRNPLLRRRIIDVRGIATVVRRYRHCHLQWAHTPCDEQYGPPQRGTGSNALLPWRFVCRSIAVSLEASAVALGFAAPRRARAAECARSKAR
jgi:hypothetical protein